MYLHVTLPNVIRNTASLLALALAACFDGSSSPDPGGFTGSRIDLDPTVVIGEVDGDPAYLFGDIRAIATDDDGRVYVGDRIGATIRAYSAAGDFIGQVAREGQGPGEIYGWPANLSFGPDGHLYVRDGSRITIFARSGSDGPTDSLADTWMVPGYGDLTYARSRVGNDGAYYYPNGSYRIGERPRFYYNVLRGGEVTGDTLTVPYHHGMEGQRTAFYRLGPGGGRMVDGLNRVPFSALPGWGVTPRGTVLSTDGVSNLVLETDLSGDTLRVLALGDDEPRPVPNAERDDSLRALEERIDSLPVPLDDVVNLGENVADRRLPEVLPNVVAVHVAIGGLIWVERWPPEGAGESRFYDVFDSTGMHLASISLRAPLVSGPPPFFGRNAVVGVVRDPENGVERVVKFSLPELSEHN